MSTRLGLLSDPHATPQPVAEALALFRRERVDQVLCAGDIAGYGNALAETIELLQSAGTICILGNHDLCYLNRQRGEDWYVDAYLGTLPSARELMIDGGTVYLVHANPPEASHGGIRLRDKEGKLDAAAMANWATQLHGFDPRLLVVGHTHQVYAERFGKTLLVNPGSCTFNHSCAIIALPECRIEWFALGGKPISVVWNWGQHELHGEKPEKFHDLLMPSTVSPTRTEPFTGATRTSTRPTSPMKPIRANEQR